MILPEPLALILVATLDAEQICAKYGNDYKLPPAAVAAAAECREACNVSLAERFANGKGVERNFDVAEYFLCKGEEEIAPAEFDGMFEHLQAMRAGTETADLAFCDYVTSGYGLTYCANVQYDERMPQLEARIDALRARAPAKSQFDSLRASGAAYVQAETDRIGEQSRGGTGYVAFTLGAEIDAKERLVADLERWSAARAPAASAAASKQADDELNAAYREARKEIDDIGGEAAAEEKTRLRDAQRAWIAYRDAFAAYYAERWRGEASPEALRREIVTQLTRDRTVALRDN